MTPRQKFYITTPIYYANSLPHLGHLYTTIVADTVTRYKRQRGLETYFLTGTDEHGINIERAAERNQRTPKEQVDYVVGELKKMFAAFSLDTEHGGYDIFMRTTEPFHYEGVSELWRRCARAKTPKGREAIYKGHYEGWFCAPCAAYKTEDEYIKPERAGDPPLCPIHELPLDRISEESYFFRLSDYGDALLELYQTQPDFVRPEVRRNEVTSFVQSGLQDLSISRLKTSVSWGIPVPDDPAHTMFVWFDALSNYITAIGFGNEERESKVGFEKFWPAIHLIGKDILRQHAIYWPTFLMAAGLELPRAVIAHGMWLDPVGRKMSKTLGNTVELELLHKYFQTDAVRYFCLREMMFGQDSKVGYESIIERANSDLASGLGNLSSRTLTMIQRYCDGVVPAGEISETSYLSAKRAGVDPDPMALVSSIEHARDQFISHMEEFAFSRALEAAWSIVARVDKMISDAKPWELAKHEEQREILNAVLYRAAEALRWLCVLLFPAMPEATRLILKQLGLQADAATTDPSQLTWGDLQAGTRINEIQPLFPRLDKKKIMAEIEKEKSEEQHTGTHATEADAVAGSSITSETQPAPPQTHATEAEAIEGVQFIEIGDFAKVDLRVGQILTAERIPKSDKLLRFTIDLGEAEPRQVLAGIAEYYEPEKLIGRKVVVVANLKPRKLRGFESQGMVCAASVGDEGRPVLATFIEDVPNGARLK
ncbi:MAG: methionine--tRNA ligase [Acidobacteria bacterium]|nr:methionine--tRNA ligase [Acidobacteriota bacterium]